MFRNKLGLWATTMAVSVATGIVSASADEATVVELTQVPCQFIEAENGIDRGFESKRKADCQKINKASETDRIAESKPFVLKPGNYIFRVTNKSVPYTLGFWIRSKKIEDANAKPVSVAGGGLRKGTSKDYHVTLKPGEYVYSCPLNTTPNYKLIVEG